MAINAAPLNLGGTPTLNKFLVGDGLWGYVGGKGFFLTGPAYDVGANVLMLFEVVFMETAGYIIVGAICERITFGGFLLAEMFMGAILYPIFGCWVWGGGWMSQLGNTMGLGHGYCRFRRFDGSARRSAATRRWRWPSCLVRASAKYGKDGKPHAFPAHNIVFVVTGTFILLFGWMGFNPGSTLAATDLRISVVAINTNLAACAGSAAALLFWYMMFGKPDISMACNGMLAGLVAITAPCAFVGADVSRSSSEHWPAFWCASVCCSMSVCSKSTIRAVQFRCTATAARSVAFASASLPTARTALAGTASGPTTYLDKARAGCDRSALWRHGPI